MKEDRKVEDSFEKIDNFFMRLGTAEPYMVDTVLDVFSKAPKLFPLLNDVIEYAGDPDEVRTLTEALEECINGDDFLTYTEIDDNGRKFYGFVDDPQFEEHLGTTLNRVDNLKDSEMSAKCVFFANLDDLADLLENFLDPSNYLIDIITEEVGEVESGKFDYAKLASHAHWAD